MFDPVDAKVSFPDLEKEVLAFWEEHRIFQRSVDERPDDRLFVFYEGPPTANARPGIHHVLSRVFKDIIPRYRTMQGDKVPRRAGWDTHGLPVELEIERELGLRSKPEIEAFGIAEFNERCKTSVSRYVEEWTDLSKRIGFWSDLDHPYVTYHNAYIETCWWIFKRLWDAGYVHRDYRSTPHCPRCETSLSSHEVSQGYEDNTVDPSVYVAFPLDPASRERLGPAVAGFDGMAAIVAWTTTPWTLPGNTALAVKEDARYGAYEHEGQLLILATALAEPLLGEGVTPSAVFGGRDLVGLTYEPLYRPEDLGVAVMRFDENGRLRRILPQESTEGLRRVIAADYVSLDDGTGIVHIAPAYGAEDFVEGRKHGLLFIHNVDLQGTMAEGLPGGGTFAKEADKAVTRDLRERGQMVKSGTVKHTYPFCWRCKTPLLYYAKPSWYIRTTAQKASLNEGNERINWYPDHIKTGRFGNWLENNVDWAVSRERYWGTPLPFWVCELCGSSTCVGSQAELAERAREKQQAAAMTDLHRPYIDEITIGCTNCGGTMRRVPEVADAWFDSGAMPYAQWHYPFENDPDFLRAFPADFICEAIDQTRGWFYTLHAEATMLNAAAPEDVPDSIAYKNVICLGHILDEQGRKMSKSLGNTVVPWDVLDQTGADAVRWYMFTASPAGSSRRFSAPLVEEGLRRFMLTLWNTYSFFVSYANIDQVDPRQQPQGELPQLDRWILSELNALIARVTEELDAYDPTDAGRAIEAFVDDLSNWYVRRSRRRFWRGAEADDADKRAAYSTLYTCLVTLSKLTAPFIPFTAEHLWQNLVRKIDADAPESVHLAEWPVADAALIDEALNAETQLVKRVASLGRAARAKAQIKVRQPVAEVVARARTAEENEALRRNEALVLEELNAKALRVTADDSDVVTYDIKPNLPVLGPKYGRAVGEIRAALAKLDPAHVAATVRREIPLVAGEYTLEPGEILLDVRDAEGYAAASEMGYTVAIATTVTPELADEGLARELVRRIQEMRRAAGFDLADRITTWYATDGDLARVVQAHGDYIKAETLSTELAAGAAPEGAHTEQHDIDGATVTLGVRRN